MVLVMRRKSFPARKCVFCTLIDHADRLVDENICTMAGTDMESTLARIVIGFAKSQSIVIGKRSNK